MTISQDELIQEWLFGIPNEYLYSVQYYYENQWSYLSKFTEFEKTFINTPRLFTKDEAIAEYFKELSKNPDWGHRVVRISRFLQPNLQFVNTEIIKSNIR